MKPKEYIEKYNIGSGWKPECQKQFLSELTSELIAFCEYNKAEDNIRGFDNSVNVIRMKWDAISRKISYGLPEKMWSYFYATVIAPLRDSMCPREAERRRLQEERRQEEIKARREWAELRGQRWVEEAERERQKRMAAFILAFLLVNQCPTDSFAFLGLPESASEEDIKARYREMAVECHPDNGGSQEVFIQLTEHKNKCLKWAKR